MFDPATWREAARQLREEADLCNPSTKAGALQRAHLRLMARRFENEASRLGQRDIDWVEYFRNAGVNYP